MNTQDVYTSVLLRAADIEADQETINSYKKIWWYNLRAKDVGGLRMTDNAYEFVESNEIKTYVVDIPKEIKLTAQVLLWLDKFIDSPYYINKHKITVLKESTAFELYLFSGDVKKLGYAKAMNKRLFS
jgi:hypothetical protein